MSTRRALERRTREQDFPAWYQAVVREADLAEVSPVRGLYDHQAVGLRHLGANPGGVGSRHQGTRQRRRPISPT